MFLYAVENAAGEAVGLLLPLRVGQNRARLQQQFQIAEIAMAKRVIAERAMRQRGLNGRGDFRAGFRIAVTAAFAMFV